MVVLGAIDLAPGNTIRERIRHTAERTFTDPLTGQTHRFTWRTISTWLYRFKKHGITCIENTARSDKGSYRKVQPNELAEAIAQILPGLRPNKVGVIPRSVVYRQLLDKGLFTRSQLSPTGFYRMLREHGLMDTETTVALRQSFAMQYANELWQADTMHGPSLRVNGAWKKTFLIAFIDDASRVITHAQFFYRDNTAHLIDAFRSALYKRGRPERLYFDNGANYSAKEILQACLRLGIALTHAPVRDGAAKGKIERFFRGFRDRFLTCHTDFDSLDDLNRKTTDWIENHYNRSYHSGIGMVPIDRFNLDARRLVFLTDHDYADEVFFVEETRKVNKTNLFSLNGQRLECPVDLREKTITVRFDRTRRDTYIVYLNDRRIGPAHPVNLTANGHRS
jgi:transposase InsO family protein